MDRDIALGVGGFFLAIIVMAGGLIYLVNWGSSVSCARTAEVMKLEYRYSFMTECMVLVDGNFEPLRWQRSIKTVSRYGDQQ